MFRILFLSITCFVILSFVGNVTAQEFSLEKQADKVMNVYLSVLNKDS